MPRTTTVQQPRIPGLVDERYDVLVNGRKIGNLCRNKHRMWIGDFDTGPAPTSLEQARALTDYADRHGLAVAPSRRKADVVARVLARQSWHAARAAA
jgi:hypothetical protein